jgi:hypothetical protein
MERSVLSHFDLEAKNDAEQFELARIIVEGEDKFELEVSDRQTAADYQLDEGDNHLPLDEEHEEALVEDWCILSESKRRHHNQDHNKSGDIDERIEGDSLHELCEDNY